MRNNFSKIAILAGISLALAFTFSCSDDKSGGGGGNAPVKREKISGVSQKGPFVRGSSVTLFELNGNLVQTGNSFQSTITNNEGFFEINGISFASPYVRLKVDGYYYNEVSGKQSTSSITLYAIADLTNKSSLNVNLLTHLEHEKVQKLVEEGESFVKAKKRAQQEILKAFGISGDFTDSEDMSIFGSSEGSAILLAISVLLQGERTEASFTDLLMDFNQSIKNSSEWSIAKRTELADWASGADFRKIRDNITAWGLAYEVPIFEKYVRKFWSDNYGLGECNPAGKELTAPNVNPLSRNEGRYYVCNGNYWEPVGNASSSSSSDGVVGSSSSSIVVLAQCGNLYYNTSSQFCQSPDVVKDLCGTATYTDAQFCAGNTVTNKCGGAANGATFDPDTEECCGRNKYVLATQFCQNGTNAVKDFCGSITYYDSDKFCQKPNVVQPLCGAATFTDAQFCQSPNVVKDLCGSATYTSTQNCCDKAPYTTATQFCQNETNVVKDLCGTATYTSTQFCYSSSSSKIASYCGINPQTYNPDLYECKTDSYGKYLNGVYLKSNKPTLGGKTYDAVLIGTQVWMASNLSYEVSIPTGSDVYRQCNYQLSDCNTNGLLYTLFAAGANNIPNSTANPSGVQGICPSGWHLPSYAEWSTLITTVGGNAQAPTKLKSTAGGWNNLNGNGGNGTDDYGFSALSSGFCSGSGDKLCNGAPANWWVSDGWKSSGYLYVILTSTIGTSYTCGTCDNYDGRYELKSVRCVKN